jgi:hypothetical protein
MKGIRLYHPWWTHLPALVLWGSAALVFASVAHRPGPWPAHWGVDGQPDRWAASWWEFPLVVLAAGAMLLVISVALDGILAQWENGRKSFNVVGLLDEVGLTLLFAAALHYAGWVRQDVGPFGSPVAWAAGSAAVVAAILLERRRPAGPPLDDRPTVDTEPFVRDLSARHAAGQRWVYWSEQAPRWARLMLVLPLTAVIVVPLAGLPLVASLLLVGVALAAGLLGGGLRTQVTAQRLTVRAGAWGPRLVSVAPSDIAEAAVRSFHPVRDFGGWGIKLGRVDGHNVLGFNLEGNIGVLVRTTKGRRYLIGTNDPERLLAVLSVARGVPTAA